MADSGITLRHRVLIRMACQAAVAVGGEPSAVRWELGDAGEVGPRDETVVAGVLLMYKDERGVHGRDEHGGDDGSTIDVLYPILSVTRRKTAPVVLSKPL